MNLPRLLSAPNRLGNFVNALLAVLIVRVIDADFATDFVLMVVNGVSSQLHSSGSPPPPTMRVLAAARKVVLVTRSERVLLDVL